MECPVFVEGKQGVRLIYDQEGPTGRYESKALLFHEALGFRRTKWSECSPWMVRAYDELYELKESPWLAALTANLPDGSVHRFHHYCVFFDELGFFEVVASGFTQDE